MVAIITGANRGLGYEITKKIAKFACVLFVVCRTIEKAKATIANLRKEYPSTNFIAEEANLDLFSSIRNCAKRINTYCNTKKIKIDILINNAGIFPSHGTITLDNCDDRLQVNALGPFLFTNLLLNSISQDGKIINLSSLPSLIFNSKFKKKLLTDFSKYDRFTSYGLSKLLAIFCALDLGKSFNDNKKIFMIHPGIVNTSIIYISKISNPLIAFFGRLIFYTPEDGAKPIISLALEEQNYNKNNVLFFNRFKLKEFPRKVLKNKLRQKLVSDACKIIQINMII